MKRSIVVGLCLLAFSASGQVNLIDTLRLDSLASFCEYSAETGHKYVFSAGYGSSQQAQTQIPYMGSAVISIDKNTFQKTILQKPHTADSFYYINYLFARGDTIRTIENVFYQDNICGCKRIEVFSNRYDENLQLIQSKLLLQFRQDSNQMLPYFLIEHNEKDIFLANEKIINNIYAGPAVYWIAKLDNDSVFIDNKRLTPYPDTIRSEYVNNISVSDSGDFLVTGTFLNYVGGGFETILFKKHQNYGSEMYNAFVFFDTTGYHIIHYSVPKVLRKKNTYYVVNAGTCSHDSTATSNLYIEGGVMFLKAYSIDSTLVPYAGVCAPPDSIPYPVPFDLQVPTALTPMQFINDSIFIDIHPSHVHENSFPYYTPCEHYKSRMGIVYWDTSLRVKQHTWISHPTDNFYINGFFLTQQKDLLVYGNMCPRGTNKDSIHLFAFLLDKNSGHLLSIFNAQDFTAQNEYEVYPNPFDEQLNIKRPMAKEETLFLYDNTGKLVLTKPLFSEKENIFTGNLPAGMYFYNIYGKDGVRKDWGKVVKEY